MKKLLLLLALVMSLVLCFTATTMAAAEKASVYVDTMIGGTVDDPDVFLGDGDGDAHETYIGFELPVDKFKFNLELLTGKWDQYYNNNLSGYDLKGGYQIIKDQDLQLYATLSKYSKELDSDRKFSGILLGADAVCNLSKKMNVEGSVDFSLSGRYEYGGYYEDASLLHFKAKLNYLITKDVSASLGYRYYGFSPDDSEEVKSKGLTLGVNLKF